MMREGSDSKSAQKKPAFFFKDNSREIKEMKTQNKKIRRDILKNIAE